MGLHDGEYQERPSGSPLLLAVGIVVALAATVGVILLTVHLAKGGRAPSPDTKVSPPVQDVTAIVKRYVVEHINDADGLEFVKWGKPQTVRLRADREKAGHTVSATFLVVRYRHKNALGGKSIREDGFAVSGGRVVHTFNNSEWGGPAKFRELHLAPGQKVDLNLDP